jgi:hypothetical protein
MRYLREALHVVDPIKRSKTLERPLERLGMTVDDCEYANIHKAIRALRGPFQMFHPRR